jgi:hypothetical protein
VLASAVLAPPGKAQDGAFDMGGLTATLSTDHVTQTERARALNDQIFNPSASPSQATAADFTYRYDRARTQQNLRNFVARTPDPAARASFEQMFAAQPTLMADIRAGIRPYGLDSHNVADAYAMWLINAWLASEKRNVDTDPATVGAVKRQIYGSFAATPDFAKMSDAERQEYAEALLLQGTMLAAGLDQVEGNPTLLDQLSQAARQGANASGIDLTTISLTPNGFVPRKGASASGAVAGDDPVRNARADTPAAQSKSSGLGIALAAGAGLGATLLGGFALMRRG